MSESLYAGISGPTFEIDAFDLGSGIVVSRTYAHLMAPFMMAFRPAPPGQHHPPPWRAAKGGFGFDIFLQVEAPPVLPLPWDQRTTLWWLIALLRLRVGPRLIVPVLASASFVEAVNTDNIQFWPLEIEPQFLKLDSESKTTIGEVDLAWVKKYWINSAHLLDDSSEFSLAFQAADQSMFARHASLALVWMWSALEALFSSGRDELRYRVSTTIASFLEPAGLGRMALQRETAKLYDSRSAAAHGRPDKAADALQRTYALLKRVVVKMIEENRVPTKAELEARLFGADPS
jgi:hypothetical protein